MLAFLSQIISKKAQAKINIAFEIQAAQWLPHKGLEFQQIQINNLDQSRTLGTLKNLRIDLHWHKILKGKKALSVLQLKGVNLRCKLEDLKAVLPSRIEPPAVSPFPKPTPAPQIPQPPLASNNQKPIQQPIKTPPKQIIQAKKITGSFLENLQLAEISDINLELTDANNRPLLNVKNAKLSLPVSGKRGYFTLDSIHALERPVSKSIKIELTEQTYGISFKSKKLDPFHLPFQFYGKLTKNLDFVYKCQGKKNNYELLKKALTILCDKIEIRIEGRGKLHRFSTWQHTLQSKLTKTSLIHPSKKCHFETIWLEMQQRGKLVQIPRLRCLGDQYQLLANGLIDQKGSTFGVCRILATQDNVKQAQRFLGGIGIYIEMNPLNTLDQKYTDLFFRGVFHNPEIKIYGKWHNVRQLIHRSNHFLQQEKQEEEQSKLPTIQSDQLSK